ncbi:transposase [Lacticaseibacillus hulanensis]|uniref:transposase n=1 Tax=Lacticaseibacillus hulanensis TaxID=2493111 RepID=UPI000FD8AB7A|nr:transposase [Lacticaseibacillus hulanensis]
MEDAYQSVFNKSAGRAAKPFRELHAAEMIKQRAHLSDAKLVEAIRDTVAFQYFMVRTRYEDKIPFNASTLTYFRRRASKISELIRNIITD